MYVLACINLMTDYAIVNFVRAYRKCREIINFAKF